MPVFGKASATRKATLHADLQEVMDEAIKYFDFSIVCGHRDKTAQNIAYREGKSKVKWPNSKHNTSPSLAVDIAPWREGSIQWSDERALRYLAGIVVAIGKMRNINIRWGGNWDMDDNFHDQSFYDLYHFELIGEKYERTKPSYMDNIRR